MIRGINITRTAGRGSRGTFRSRFLPLAIVPILGVLPQTTWAAGPWYVDPAGNNASDCLSPASACLTIGAAVTKASPGDTIHVAAGTYSEQVSINKPLTVTGADGAVLDGTGLVPAWTTGVKIRSGNVTWNNIDVTDFTQDGITAYDNIDMPNLHITNTKVSNIQPGYWGFGIYVGYESEGFGYSPPDLTTHLDFSGLLLEGNEIVNTHSSAMVIQSVTGTPGTLVVKNNFIHDNVTNSGIWVDCARELTIEDNIVDGNKWGVEFSAYAEFGTLNGPYGPKNIELRGNTITGSTFEGVAVYEGWPATIAVEGNQLDGNGNGVRNYLSEAVNAQGNWWGSPTGPTVASNPAGTGDSAVDAVDYSPWRKDGTDTDLVTPGFQPATPTTHVVNANASPAYTTGGIQDGVDYADAGDTVEVVAGSYDETNITVDKSLTVRGDASGPCPGPGPAAPEIVGSFTGSERGFIVSPGVDDVTIEGFVVRDLGVVPQTEAGGACGVWAYNTTTDPTRHVTVRNNAFQSIGWTHVFFYNEAQSAYDDINVLCNTVDIGAPDYGGDYGANQYGIECTNCINSTIADNAVSGGVIGVVMSAQTATGRSMTAGNNAIRDNTISDSDFGNIYVVPWSLGGAEPTLQGISITDNVLSNDATAIWVYNYLGSVVQDFTITGNDITVTSPAANGPMVRATSVGGVSAFENNTLSLAGTSPPSYYYGLEVSGAGTGSWSIRENVFTGGGAAGSTGAGIRLSSTIPVTASVSIDCNRISGWPTGVRQQSSCTATLGSNSIKGNTEGLSSAGAAILAENNWWGCTAGPGNPGCDTVVGASVDYDPWATFVPACVTCDAATDCSDGLFCTGDETCSASVCQAGTPPTCPDDDNVCTDDVCDGGTDACANVPNVAPCNDDIFCNGVDTCAGGACGHSGDPCSSGPECADTCNEAGDHCLTPGGTSCTADSNPCTTDLCDGSGTCAHDPGNAGAVCRAGSGDLCDPTETCTGSAADCPAEVIAAAGTVCRAGSGDLCNPTETCTGVATQACPADAFLPSSAVCRADAGDCDVAENCTGGPAACPVDAFEPSNTLCTDDADECTRDRCDGVGACLHPPIALAEACNWMVVGGTDTKTAKARTRAGATVVGNICADRGEIGESSVTAGASSWALLGLDETTVKVRPNAVMEEGDVVTAGGCLTGLKDNQVFDTGLADICCADGEVALSGGGVVNACGTDPRVAECETAKDQVTPDVALLNGLSRTQDLGPMDCSASAPCVIEAVAGLNVIDITRLRVAMNGVVTIDANGNADAVVILRIANGLKGMGHATFALSGGAQPQNVLFYAVAGACRFGNETIGAGTLFCPAGKVYLPLRSEWDGALVSGKMVEIGDNAFVVHVPFTGLAD